MNLGKMLAAGKSFIRGGTSAAYRENKRVYLPKFNAEKNPFTPKAEPAARPEAEAVTAKPVARPSVPVVAQLAAASPGPVRATKWADKLNPFRAASPAAMLPLPLVQPELLTLDDVKVLHNDLSDPDADVEHVPLKSRTTAAPEVPVLTPARESWEFMGERLLKSV